MLHGDLDKISFNLEEISPKLYVVHRGAQPLPILDMKLSHIAAGVEVTEVRESRDKLYDVKLALGDVLLRSSSYINNAAEPSTFFHRQGMSYDDPRLQAGR